MGKQARKGKTKYIAVFSDGTTVTRSSHHSYAVAWRATWQDGERKEAAVGFAVSRERANPLRPGVSLVCRHFSAARRAAARKENAAYLARTGYAVEFADAQPVSA